jgi:hypothetical protein
MVGFGISGGEASGSSSRKPVNYYDGQLGTRSRGRKVNGTDSGSCKMLGFGNSSF